MTPVPYNDAVVTIEQVDANPDELERVYQSRYLEHHFVPGRPANIKL